MQAYFIVQLDKKHKEIMELSGDVLEYELKKANKINALDLETPDFRIFNSFTKAEKFLDKYNQELSRLKPLSMHPKSMPGMLLKRRWLPLTAMKLKLETWRRYNRNWLPGTHFRLYDQTYFVTCSLIDITEIDGKFRYRYTVIK